MRDPHTNAWMEDFLESKNLLSYHGSAALDLDRFCEWDSVFNELLDKPADFVVVEIKAKGQGRGLSEHNPYRMKEVSWAEVVDKELFDKNILFAKNIADEYLLFPHNL